MNSRTRNSSRSNQNPQQKPGQQQQGGQKPGQQQQGGQKPGQQGGQTKPGQGGVSRAAWTAKDCFEEDGNPLRRVAVFYVQRR